MAENNVIDYRDYHKLADRWLRMERYYSFIRLGLVPIPATDTAPCELNHFESTESA